MVLMVQSYGDLDQFSHREIANDNGLGFLDVSGTSPYPVNLYIVLKTVLRFWASSLVRIPAPSVVVPAELAVLCSRQQRLPRTTRTNEGGGGVNGCPST